MTENSREEESSSGFKPSVRALDFVALLDVGACSTITSHGYYRSARLQSKGDLREAGSAPALSFAIEAALGQENQIVDGLSDRGDGFHLEDTWHWLTGENSVQRVLRKC